MNRRYNIFFEMKKIILSVILGVMAITASAQLKSVDFKANLRNDFGAGAGVTFGLTDKIDFAPAFNYFFVDGDATMWTIDADFHYNFDVAKDFQVYPIVGLGVFHTSSKVEASALGLSVSESNSYTKIAVNIGAGCQYNFTDKVAGFVDLKYQWVDDFDDTYFSLGVKIGL